MAYPPGWTVQCLNAGCASRGHWLRLEEETRETCGNCGAPLYRVPPPLAPRSRIRLRPLARFRPLGRPR